MSLLKVLGLPKVLLAGPPSEVEDLVGAALDEAKKRAKALVEIPPFPDEAPRDSAIEVFLDDLQTGTTVAAQHLEYIEAAAAQASKVGDLVGFDKLSEATAGLGKIAKRIVGGLGTFQGEIDKAKKLVECYKALDAFASACADMDPRDRASVEPWVDSMKRLWNASEPARDWAQKLTKGAAMRGLPWGGTAALTMGVVLAQLNAGIRALQAGVTNVNLYLDRMEGFLARAERFADGESRRPPPPLPPPWKSRKERDEDVRQRKAFEERQAIATLNDVGARITRDVAAATERDFRERLFPKIYLKHRAGLRAKIVSALAKAGGEQGTKLDPTLLEQEWYGCFVGSGKGTISVDGAVVEIDCFQNKRCPFFDTLWKDALAAHLKGVAKS